MTWRGGFLDGQVGGFTNRLGKRELAVRVFVGRSGFCLHFFWVSAIAGTYGRLLPVDGASVWHGVHILDLLPAQSATAHLGYSACTKRNRTATAVACARSDSRQSFKTLLTLGVPRTGQAPTLNRLRRRTKIGTEAWVPVPIYGADAYPGGVMDSDRSQS